MGLFDDITSTAGSVWDTVTGSDPAPAPPAEATEPESLTSTLGGWAQSAWEMTPASLLGKGAKYAEHAANSGIDWLEDNGAKGQKSLEESTAGIPVVEQLGQAAGWLNNMTTQFTGGVARGAVGLVGGLANAVAHPVDTVMGLEGMLEHVPGVGTPLKAAHIGYDMAVNGETAAHAGQRMTDDGSYWMNVGKAFIKPMVEQGEKGRWGDVAGQAAFQLALLATGVGEGGAAAEATEATSAATKLADGAEAANAATKLADGAEIASNATKLADGAEAASLLEEGAVVEAGAGKAAPVVSAEADAASALSHEPPPSITVTETPPTTPYAEPPQGLLYDPANPPPGMSKEAVEAHNFAIEQNAQTEAGRAANTALENTPAGKAQLTSEGNVRGAYSPETGNVKLNAVKDGQVVSGESQASTMAHEGDHAARLAEPGSNPAQAVSAEAAEDQLVELETQAREAQLHKADADIKRILNDGELRPAEPVIGPDGQVVDMRGELEGVMDARNGVVGVEEWDFINDPRYRKMITDDLRATNPLLTEEELANQASQQIARESHKAISDAVRGKTETVSRAHEMWNQANPGGG